MKTEIEWFKYKEKKPKEDGWCLVIKYNRAMDFLYYKKDKSEYDHFSHIVYLWSKVEYPKIY
jgi:hypothetical protein